MKAILANMLWDVLELVCKKAHDFTFDPERHARIRMKNRERWWAYRQKAERTKKKRDDMRALAWQSEFKFETPPDEARKRGDVK